VKEWQPLTKLGRLVKAKKIVKLEEIYLQAYAIKEPEIIDFFFGTDLKEETMKIKPVQKQTRAGQRTRFQAYVCVGDSNGHIGLGMKVAKEAQIAIKGATQAAKLAVIPVRRGYWGNKIGNPHTVAMKVTGRCGSIRVRLVPAPRGTGIVAPPASKKVIALAGVLDVYTSTTGATRTRGNFLSATYDALSKTYGYLTPDLWGPTHFVPSPYEKHSDWLSEQASPSKA
jgi:small subunit ribosomal protein S2e